MASGNNGRPRQGPSLDLQARTLRVTEFHPDVTKDLLQELMVQVGPVRNVVMRPDHAFIEFQHEDSVGYALAMLEGVELFGQELKLEPKLQTPYAYRFRDGLNGWLYQNSETKHRKPRMDQEPPHQGYGHSGNDYQRDRGDHWRHDSRDSRPDRPRSRFPPNRQQQRYDDDRRGFGPGYELDWRVRDQPSHSNNDYRSDNSSRSRDQERDRDWGRSRYQQQDQQRDRFGHYGGFGQDYEQRDHHRSHEDRWRSDRFNDYSDRRRRPEYPPQDRFSPPSSHQQSQYHPKQRHHPYR